MHLGLAEWVVLTVLDERPAHGFAIAAITARDGDVGRVWHVPRPVVYRALGRLEEAELIVPSDAEAGPGPQRIPFSVTREGHSAAAEWLRTPVRHVRELRSQFLVKLALHERRGSDPEELVARQRAVLAPIARALAAEHAASAGFDRVLVAWRASTANAALGFLDEVGARGT